MGLAINDEHVELQDVARRFLASQGKSLAREATDGSVDRIDGLWSGMVAQGWPGLHVAEENGGQGFGLAELAVVLAELGRVAAPGPLAASGVVSALLECVGSADQKRTHLTALADGSRTAAIALDGEVTLANRDGNRIITGRLPGVIGAVAAQMVADVDGDDVVIAELSAPGSTCTPVDAIDRTLGITAVDLDGLAIGEQDVVAGAAGLLRALARSAFAADAQGIAQATLEAAVDYAETREQFGRPIGAFQAVKHHCADMAVKAELATAAVWDASRCAPDSPDFQYVAAAAAATAFDAAIHNAQLNIQIHGGMGFTWEHDAHISLRRAIALAQLVGPVPTLQDHVYGLASDGARRVYSVELPAEAEAFRPEVQDFARRYAELDRAEARQLAVEAGYLVPHWPKPFGRAAGAVEQLVIAEELSGVELPGLGIGGWIMQTFIQHGTPDQIERWVQPTLMGELTWCQLFSEPGAGSDAAAISTRAVRVDGGWTVTGQKIWTSGAESSDRGLATVRTDPKAAKHEGITTVVVDLAAPGVTVRPLRELTGMSLFNEVFFDAVFIPDEDVVGDVGKGWTVARSTLGNERVTIGDASHLGITARDLIELLASSVFNGDRGTQRRIGALLAEGHAMSLIGLRRAVRALAGGTGGGDGNISKLLSAEHAQRVSELALEFSGAAAALGGAQRVTSGYLFDRCLTIGGGTSEISRNVIAERLLGLPRDPSVS